MIPCKSLHGTRIFHDLLGPTAPRSACAPLRAHAPFSGEDPGFGEDPGAYSAPNPPRSPNLPRSFLGWVTGEIHVTIEAELRGVVEAWIADDPDAGDRAELRALLDRAFPESGTGTDPDGGPGTATSAGPDGET